ncbi:MAG: YihY/virulence factor BrkB family protein [Acidobacteriota bacterium]|nr:YihY/virulence factor BrkB family protein [Acidobacteriota bacterium]
MKETFEKWNDHDAPRLGAALAFYSILSLAPLVMIAIAIVSLIFGRDAAQSEIGAQLSATIGQSGADAVKTMLASSHKASSGTVASIIGIATLLLGASGVCGELRASLNKIWDAKPTDGSGIMGMIKERSFAFGMVLAVGFLLLVSMVVSAALATLGKFAGGLLPIPAAALEILNFAVSFGVITLLFALIYKYVPSVDIDWKDVWIGAIATALLFTIGKFLIGLYLAKAGVGSAYGAAGSLVAVIVWVYYSAQIFFFGAEFTQVYAHSGHSV